MRIGIDVGGTTIKAGVVSEEGRILFQSAIDTKAGRDYRLIFEDMIKQIEALLTQAGCKHEELKSIGIGIPGLADYKTGNVIYCTNMSWTDVPLGSALQAHFNKPVYLENDATVAGLAESVMGSTKGFPNSVFLTLGTGIGGGIIINHKTYSGSHSAGSEIGHMIVGENFYECNCGNNGCLETFASATAMIRYAAHRIEKDGIKSSILEKAGGKTENINAKAIFDAAKEGDSLGLETVNRMIKYLAIGIINIMNMLDPDIIAIGGGVSKAGDYLIGLLKQQVGKMLFSCNVQYADIVLAELGNEAGIIGAAFLG